MADLTFTDDAADLPRPRRHFRENSLTWEIIAVVIALFSVFLMISLLVGPDGDSLIGPVGTTTSRALRFLFGNFVAFAIPAFVLWFAFQLFFGYRARWSPTRSLGICVLVLAATGMLALPHADNVDLRPETFARAGAIGTFMVEWEGLRLVGTFGMIGAAMVLVAMAIVGFVMITRVSLSDATIRMVAKVRERRAAAPRVIDVAQSVPVPSLFSRQRWTKAVPAEAPERVTESTDDVPTQPTPSRSSRASRDSGMFGGIFARSKDGLLSEALPEEQEEYEFNAGYDEDALAASRALEEARIDEEYERALIAEESNPAVALADDEDEGEDIIFHDGNIATPILEGNPANEEDDDDAVGDGLAKLFPKRWKKSADGAISRRKNINDIDEAEVRDRAESRALRQASDDLDEVQDDDELADGEAGEENDPLFDESLDARPAGPMAARQAAAISAVEREDEVAAERREILGAYKLPDIQLLDDPPRVDTRMSREEMLEISQTLERTFADFGIAVKVIEVKQGPVVTRFELKPAPGVKVSRIVGLEHDVALAMRASSVRVVAPIPGKAAVGIEIPNKNRAGVYVKELVSCSEFWDHSSPLAFALGKTIEGQPYFADLKKMPHLLIAGATGAGKSVCLNTIICSLLYRQRPDRVRLLMVDPKRVELSIYRDIPHLISPVVCDAKRAAAALNWAVEQMEERYKKLVEYSVRNIDGYNEIVLNPDKQAKHRGKNLELMPHMVIIVDELADLMVVAKAEVEESIQRLAQMARAVGIHLILATQRPSVNVITGIIKANFPTRIAFQVSQKVDSRTILDSNGAETLLGRGDMLFAPPGAGKAIRIQGAFLSDEEVERIADHCRAMAQPMYDVDEFEPLLSEKEQREMAKLMGPMDMFDDLDAQDRMVRGTNKTMGKVSAGLFVPHEGGSAGADDEEIDEALVRAAARIILEGRKGSTSLIQRRLKVGFARAGRLMDMLQEMGIVGEYNGSKPREILVDCDAALDQLDSLEKKIRETGDSKAAAAELDDEE
ncbi:DNA translocase FtsK [Candidatus Sumerlaeota bacterium]|nr:DNA translocase FtsK [Candidatus Sumerlaeota bacterium]